MEGDYFRARDDQKIVIARSGETGESDEAISGLIEAIKAASRRDTEFAEKDFKQLN